MAVNVCAPNPVLYDCFSVERLLWPSLSCRWAGLFKEDKTKKYHHIYFSEQTEDNGRNTLIFAECEVSQKNVTSIGQIRKAVIGERESLLQMKRIKTIIHPGEVNKIREFPQYSNIVATHTDSPDVLVWDVNQQKNRVVSNSAKDSVPNLILKGHKQNAEYALAMSPKGSFVLSGGQDKSVILWNIEDQISGSVMKSISATEVLPRGVFQGHQDIVEDVQFNPNCSQEFCSVGDDSYLITWDVRTGTKPISKWCPERRSAFGSSDQAGYIKIWDYDKVGKIREVDGYKTAGDGLVFEHQGHSGRMVHDFHWNPHDPWTVVSVSNDVRGGGNLQIWRMLDFLYKPEQEALEQVERFMRGNQSSSRAGKV